MTTQSERETIAARWLIKQDDPEFTEEQCEELVKWLIQSVENCRTYVELVGAWRWTVLLYPDEVPLMYESGHSKASGATDTSTRAPSRKGALDRRFGNLLRSTREQRGFSQAELAARAGMRVGEIGRIETGERPLTLDSTYVLARALGVAPSRLVAQLERVMRGKAAAPRKRKSR